MFDHHDLVNKTFAKLLDLIYWDMRLCCLLMISISLYQSPSN